MTLAEILMLVQERQLQFRRMTKLDFMAFAGCEGATSLIAEYKGTTIVVDDDHFEVHKEVDAKRN